MKPVKTILAVKNGRRRSFTKAVWDIMPTGKYGYQKVVEEDIPDEVKEFLKEENKGNDQSSQMDQMNSDPFDPFNLGLDENIAKDFEEEATPKKRGRKPISK